MFGAFFYLLRARGLDVSLNEWLTLIEALDKGLAGSNFTSFYYLTRSILVKSETEFDTFDGAFLEYFKNIQHFEELPKELLDWLNNPSEKKNNYDKAQDDLNKSLTMEEIQNWRGSESDKIPDIPELAGLKLEKPVISGHKKTVLVTKELERLHALYPEGGVIIALVGMSNGLGPILSARTDWPLISVCTTANEFPEDVWSALRMPSNVPNATMLDAKNAVLCALNILGQKNPAIYAHRRKEIEELDD